MSRQTPFHFPKQNFANLTAAVPPIVQFLTNNHPSIPGPGYRIIEAYDGTTREVPSDPLDLNSFSSGFGWRVDVASIPLGAWIVLESVRAAGNQFQVYLELDTATVLHILLITDGNWTTGLGPDADPTIPGKCLGSSTTAFASNVAGSLDLVGFTAAADYTLVADLSVIVFLFDPGSNSATWTYAGEVDQARPGDTRPYILWFDPLNVHFNPSSVDLSCVDFLTQEFVQCSTVSLACERATSDTLFEDDGSANFLGSRKLMPVGIHQLTGPAAGTKGWMRHVWSGERTGGAGPVTFSGRSFLGRSDATTEGQVVLAWDRETP